MKIIKVNVKDINPAPYNPRVDLKPGDPDYEKLDGSIKEFGCVEPLVWNERTGNLVGGHQRFKILQAQGVTEVDVSIVDLSLEREKALNIALNKIQGAWDEEKLAELLQELSQVPDFNVTVTGFDHAEINCLFDEFLTPNLDATGETPPESGTVSITQRGDLIQLGGHRLLCGDSGSTDYLKSLIGDQRVQMVFTDPPYGCSYDPSNRPVDGGSSEWIPIANDGLPQDEYEPWLRGILECAKPFLGAGAPMYLWNGHRQFGPMHSILTELGFHVSNVITWVKPFPNPGYGDYQMASEFCLYSWLKDGGAHRWYGPATESNVWESPRDGVSSLIHPSQKPASLAQRAIKNSSRKGDLVLDLFAGSGSLLVAAQSMERICCAMELEPSYCDAIVRRYIKTFGRESVSTDVFQRYWKEV
jgi:DNA modification methylase